MNRLILITSLLLSYCIGFAQTDCRPYIPTEVGTIWEITNYSPKGKATGKQVNELLDKSVSGTDMTFSIKTTTYDKNDEQVFETTYEAYCVDGRFELDMTYRMDGSAMQAYQDMDMEVDASKFELPDLDAAVGTQLEDGSLDVAIQAGGALNLNMTVLITDRKIEARESMTTSAGTFDCVVLTQTINTKMIIGVQASSKEWYAPGIGAVRMESYNKRGKLTGYSEVTRIEQI